MTLQRIGPYELTGTLGRGASGTVFRARLAGSSEDGFAIKVLHRPDPRALQRFERERRFLSDPALDGFVRLLDAGESQKGPWLVMPLLPGGDLRRKLQAGPLPCDEAIALGQALGRALGTAHAAGIVHRDLKPENILFDAEGRPLIADLGLARHFQTDPGVDKSAALTKTGEMAGTIGYAPREQMADAAAAGPPADVFALGAILFECLAGGPAFRGASVLEVVAMIERGDRPRLARSELPRHVALAIEQALAPDPSERFQDGAAFAAALSGEPCPAPPGRGRPGLLAVGALTALGLGALVLARLGAERSPGERGASGAPAATTTAAETERATNPTAAVVSSARPVARVLVPLYRPRRRSGPPDTILGLQLYQKAHTADSDGDFRKAIALAEEGLDADPENARLWMMHGRARLGAGLPGALEDAEEALRIDPELVAAWMVKADALAAAGDRKALEAADRCIELEPDKPASWRTRSTVAWAVGESVRSVEDLRHAIALGDKASFLGLDLVSLTDRLISLGRGAEAVAPLRSLVALLPGDATSWRKLGDIELDAKHFEAAKEAFTRAAELQPDDPSLARRRAMVLTGLDSLEEARAECDRWIRLAPKDPDAYLARAHILGRLHDVSGLIADCKVAQGLDPKRVGPWQWSADAHNSLGQYHEALEEAERVIALDPKAPFAWCERAAARSGLKDVAGARADLDHAIEIDPSYAPAYSARGTLRKNLGDLNGAIADHREAIRLGGDRAVNGTALARDLLLHHDFDAALAAAEEAVAAGPGTYYALDARGEARLEKGDFPGALTDLEKAAELAPDNPPRVRYRGWARANVGDLEGARKDLEHVAPTSADPRSFYWRGFVREKLGDRPGAASDFAACLKAGASGETADLARAALARVR